MKRLVIILLLFSLLCPIIEGKTNLKLQEDWYFRQVGTEKWYPAKVPGCVHTDLLRNGLIDDPYYRTNERALQWIDREDWEYRTVFIAPADALKASQVYLLFEGLDTYASVYLNGEQILSSDNMFRAWKADVSRSLKKGRNELLISFRSPIAVGLEKLNDYGFCMPASNDQAENGGLLPDQRISVFERKAPYHFGWDWGPRFVTSGIWRPVHLVYSDDSYIEDLYIHQTDISAELAQCTAIVGIEGLAKERCKVQIADAATGKVFATSQKDIVKGYQEIALDFEIENPLLWWTNGLGPQNMYEFESKIIAGDRTISKKSVQIGLRSLKLIERLDTDGKGSSLYFELNGKPVFMKGANHIPNDMFIDRMTDDVYRNEIDNAVSANMNMLRVWGGGIYENDSFYNYCDCNGILIWQDFMFACSMYPGNAEFLENVREEARYNVKRLRNHPCIALWCGNNEIDSGWQHYNPNGGWPSWKKQSYTMSQRENMWKAYVDIFKTILPEVISELDPECPYRHSSPMVPTPGKHANTTHEGDIHYWGVWHGREPFSAFENNSGRFVSEYGFQSFPEMKTIRKYTLPEDYDINSEVMNAHQRSAIGNEAIRDYMKMYYDVPAEFEDFIYLGQVLQAESIKSAVDIHRGNMPYTMGSLYWQINDCWPVASWSSTDYFREWKALHYFMVKAFKPVTIVRKDKPADYEFRIVSDLNHSIEQAAVHAEIIDFSGHVLWTMDLIRSFPELCNEVLFSIGKEQIKDLKSPNILFHLMLSSKNGVNTDRIFYFADVKDMILPEPKIKLAVSEGESGTYIVNVSSDKLVKNLALYVRDIEGKFSDNYFDVLPGQRVSVNFICRYGGMTLEKFIENLNYKHIQQINYEK